MFLKRLCAHVSRALQDAANAVQLQQDQLQASKTLLATVKAALDVSCHNFVTSTAHKSLLDSLGLISQLAADMMRLDAQQDYSHKAPGWHPLQLQLQAAASDAQATLANTPRSGLPTDAQPGSASHPQQPYGVGGEASVEASMENADKDEKGAAVHALEKQWHGRVEEAIKQLLLWAQGVHSSSDAAEPFVIACRLVLLDCVCVTWAPSSDDAVAIKH